MSWVNSFKLRQAVQIISKGGVIAYPTEAVWGLGCDPANPDAVQKLLAIKEREVEKGLILVASSISQCRFLLQGLSDSQLAELNAHWPGPYTYLLPHHHLVPSWISGRYSSVAVRVSAHPVVKALCDEFGAPIVSTSANRSGQNPAKTRLQLSLGVEPLVDFVMPGQVGAAAKPTTIKDILTGEVLRAGG